MWLLYGQLDLDDNAKRVGIPRVMIFQVKPHCRGILKEVNMKARELEEKILAPTILAHSSSIRGVICISTKKKSMWIIF